MTSNDTMQCTANCCSIELFDKHKQVTMEMSGGVRHAYECPCGAITLTMGRGGDA